MYGRPSPNNITGIEIWDASGRASVTSIYVGVDCDYNVVLPPANCTPIPAGLHALMTFFQSVETREHNRVQCTLDTTLVVDAGDSNQSPDGAVDLRHQ
jgi:hypothetical protein